MRYLNFSATTALAGAIGIALFIPQPAAAAWPESAFAATNVSESMVSLFGSADNTPSGKIRIVVPETAEAGAAVPVTVETGLAASAIAIIVEKNPTPLAANFELSDYARAFVETSIVVCKTSDVIIVVKSGGKLFTGRRNVRVSGGDCAAAGGGKLKGKKSIRARARLEGSAARVDATIGHPMGAGHITEVTATHKDENRLLLTAQWGPFVSAKPRLAFRFSGAAPGATVELTWIDNQGRSDSAVATVK